MLVAEEVFRAGFDLDWSKALASHSTAKYILKNDDDDVNAKEATGNEQEVRRGLRGTECWQLCPQSTYAPKMHNTHLAKEALPYACLHR